MQRSSAGALAGILAALVLAAPAAATEAAPASAGDHGQAAHHAQGAAQASASARQDRIIADLAQRDPAAAKAYRRGLLAYQDENDAVALEAYQAVLAAHPRFTPALRRACVSATNLDKRKLAISLCRRAVAVAPVPRSQVDLAYALAWPPSNADMAPPADQKEARKLITQVLDHGGDHAFFALSVAGSVATSLRDPVLMHRAAMGLAKVAPHTVAGTMARMRDALWHLHYKAARRFLAEAHAAGVTTGYLAPYKRYLDKQEPFWWRWTRPAALEGEAALAVVVLLIVVGAVVLLRGLKKARGPGGPGSPA